jgi:hypothetical protein
MLRCHAFRCSVARTSRHHAIEAALPNARLVAPPAPNTDAIINVACAAWCGPWHSVQFSPPLTRRP